MGGGRQPTSPKPADTPAMVWGGWDASVQDDPFPTLASAREQGPVHPVVLPDGHRAWVVVGYALARQTLKEPRLSKDMQAALADSPDTVAEGLPGLAFSRHMLNLDPPDHTRLRRLVSAAFTPARVASLAPWIRTATGRCLDRLSARPAGTVVDLVAEFAGPLPFDVICQLLGLPEADRDPLRRSFRSLLRPWSGEPPADAVAASDAIVGYMESLVATESAHPGDNLVGDLVRASVNDRLDHRELLSTVFQLIVAGHDTTTNMIANAVVALLDHPDQLAAVLADQEMLASAVEELLRFAPPGVNTTFRYTSQPVDLGPASVPAGEQVLVCVAAANRDEQAFDRPDALDVTRKSGRHLSFGHGTHSCLGAPLARLELQIALGELLYRFPHLRLGVQRDQLHWNHGDGVVLRGLGSLPVVLGPDVRAAAHARPQVGPAGRGTGLARPASQRSSRRPDPNGPVVGNMAEKAAEGMAENYERHFVPVVGEPLAVELLDASPLREGDRVLDVACGTGVVARLAARRVGLGGAVCGIDPSPEMLAVARAQAGHDIEWVRASADRTTRADGLFDVVLCSLGLQFVADHDLALRELSRVLDRGGRLAIGTVGPMPALFGDLAEALDRQGQDDGAAFLHAVFSLHDRRVLRRMLEAAGFREVAVRLASVRLRLPPPREFLWQLLVSTPLAPSARRLGEEGLALLERSVLPSWDSWSSSGGFVIDMPTVIATGHV